MAYPQEAWENDGLENRAGTERNYQPMFEFWRKSGLKRGPNSNQDTWDKYEAWLKEQDKKVG